ncbi:MAG: DUF5348 domain-containing protein [Firmicutes bacterium]|nr:DUF5348 domain-containing protein [Bacillota bacterium]
MFSNIYEGVLNFDMNGMCFEILFEDGDTSGSIMSGTVIEVLIDDQWRTTRIKFEDDWYLEGFEDVEPQGLPARMEV